MATRQNYFAHLSVGTSGTPTYFPISGRPLGTSVESAATHRFTAAAVARSIRVKLDLAAGIGKSRDFYIRINGVTQLVLTMGESAIEGSITGSVSIPEDALVCLAYEGSGGPASTRARVTLTVDYVDDGVSCYGGGGPFGGGTRHTGAFSSASSWDGTGPFLQGNPAPCPGTIDRFVANLSDAVPAGETMVLDVRLNNVAEGLALTIPEGETTAEMDCSVAFVADDRVTIAATASYAGTPSLSFGIRVVSTDGYSIMCSANRVQYAGANTARFTPPTQGGASTQSTESPSTVWGGLSSFQVRDLHGDFTAGAVTADPVTLSARKNGSSTALEVTSSGLPPLNQQSKSNASDVITISPTDLFDVRFLTGTRWFQGQVAWGMVQVAFAVPDDEEEPEPATPGTIGPIIWVTQPREQISSGSPGSPDAVINPSDSYSDLELQDPAAYYGSWKDPWLTHAGDAVRQLSDPLTGELMASTFEYALSDPEFRFREQLGGQTDKYWTRYPTVFRLTSRANRSVLGRPFVGFAGPIVGAQPTRNGFDFTLGDIVTQRLLSDKLQVPWRLIRDGFLDQLTHISEKLDLEQPEPIIYGTHDRSAGIQGSPANQGTTGYQIVPIYLGIENVEGVDRHVWMVAGHACKSVTVYIDGEERGSGDGWDVELSIDKTSSTYGDQRRYTLIYCDFGGPSIEGSGPFHWSVRVTQGDFVAIGDMAITVAVEGVEETGDSSGALITDLYQQYKHFLINYIANAGPSSYMRGAWLDCPTWDLNDQVVTVIDEDSFDTVSAIRNITGAVAIGVRAGDRNNPGQWIAAFNRSGWCQLGQTRPTQLGITTLHPTQAAKDAAFLYTDNYEILQESFSTAIQWDRHATHVPWRNDYEHTTALWQTSGVEATPEATNYPEQDASIREYPFAPGSTQGSYLASLEAGLIANPPRMIRFTVTVGPDPVSDDSLAYRNLGDYITFLHYDAVQPDVSARAIRLAQVQRVTISGSDRKIHVDALDCDDLIGGVV